MYAKFFRVAFFLCFLRFLCASPARGGALTPFSGEIRPWSPGAPTADRKFIPRAGIAPHHGLASEIIAHFYDNFSEPGFDSESGADNVERVILIGPDHFKAGRRSITLSPLPWRTGGVMLEIDAHAFDALSRTGAVGVESLPFRLEHSIGLHIVFIGSYFPNAKVTSLMVNNAATPWELSRLVPVLSELLADGKTLLILSMDFSHDKMPEEARREDDKSVEHILSFNTEGLRDLDIDAPAATWLFLEVLKSRGVKDGFLLERANSSELIGRLELPCTGYATMLFR